MRDPSPTNDTVKARKNIRLGERDFRILKAVGDYQVLTTTQIRRLLFPSLSRARKRLRQLTVCGLLRQFRRPVVIGTGSSDALYFPTPKTIKMLERSRLISKPHKLRVPKIRSEFFLDHTLARNDFRIGLELACRTEPDLELRDWKHDRSIASSVKLVRGDRSPTLERLTIVPDGQIDLVQHGEPHRLYVEIDRGTTSLRRIQLKMLGYVQLSLSTEKMDFTVLWTAESTRRMHNLIQAARDTHHLLAAEKIFRFAVGRPEWSANPARIFSSVWLSIAGSLMGPVSVSPRNSKVVDN